MPDYILIQDAQHKWKRVAEKDLPDEATLQRLIRETPEVLPLDDLGDDVPSLLSVGRETALANGYVDVIGVDQDGLITIIECKLDRNPEVKRTVIGQVLGYAAYLWGMSYEQFEASVVRKYFDSKQCHRADFNGLALDDAMERFRHECNLDGNWRKEEFRQKLEANLLNGRFRLVIVVDKVNDELRRTVEYLNACTSPNFSILCAELRYFATEHTQLLVPTLIGKPSIRKTTANQGGETWKPERFFPALRERKGEAAELAARRLLKWCEQYAERVYWGNGAKDGSFNAMLVWDSEHVVNAFGVWTYGTVEVGFQYAKPYPPFDNEGMRREWLKRLKGIDDKALSADSFNRRPNFPLTALADEKKFQQFVDTMAWVIKQLQAARDTNAG
jgi:hypothetical protein